MVKLLNLVVVVHTIPAVKDQKQAYLEFMTSLVYKEFQDNQDYTVKLYLKKKKNNKKKKTYETVI